MPESLVYDFSATWFWEIPTNEGYEPPQTKIEVIDRTARRIRIYEVEAIAPQSTITVRHSDKVSTIKVASLHGTFERHQPYVFRFGFWVDSPSSMKFENLRTTLPIFPYTYPINFFNFSNEVMEAYRQQGILDNITNCRLWTKLDGGSLLPTVEALRRDGRNANPQDFDGPSSVPHSDLWIALHERREIRTSVHARHWQPVGKSQYPPYQTRRPLPFDLYHIRAATLPGHPEWAALSPRASATHDLLNLRIIPKMDYSTRILQIVAFLSVPSIVYSITLSLWWSIGSFIISYLGYLLITESTR